MTEAEWNACTDLQPMLEFHFKAVRREVLLLGLASTRIWQAVLILKQANPDSGVVSGYKAVPARFHF